MSLAQEMIVQVSEAALREKAVRIERIVVLIGAYAGIERDAFEFIFPLAAEGTLAEGAELEIEWIPARGRCRACRSEFTPDPACLVCTHCGSNQVELLGGREFMIRSIDLEMAG